MTAERAQRAIEKLAVERKALIEWVHLLVGIVRSFLREHASADAGEAARRFSIDDWNEEQILSRRETSIDALVAEMESKRGDLNAAIAEFTDEQLDKTFHFGGDKSRSPREVQGWHMEDARRAITGEAEQPFGDKSFGTMLTTDPPPA
jgi:hypothetical protein